LWRCIHLRLGATLLDRTPCSFNCALFLQNLRIRISAKVHWRRFQNGPRALRHGPGTCPVHYLHGRDRFDRVVQTWGGGQRGRLRSSEDNAGAAQSTWRLRGSSEHQGMSMHCNECFRPARNRYLMDWNVCMKLPHVFMCCVLNHAISSHPYIALASPKRSGCPPCFSIATAPFCLRAFYYWGRCKVLKLSANISFGVIITTQLLRLIRGVVTAASRLDAKWKYCRMLTRHLWFDLSYGLGWKVKVVWRNPNHLHSTTFSTFSRRKWAKISVNISTWMLSHLAAQHTSDFLWASWQTKQSQVVDMQ